ncbi:MAG: sigma 54-interacting transcriptional regulator, partial [Myxococcota bacterium]|nr:sigma 54-interacting transcriptional regulator [Myxococcota bacterium]MDW8364161.1 sigma 54-interacting transcriptional regulator [Myxococcales bacterium]
LQAKLLRVLEARVVVPVGGERAVPIDVRLVAATHRDLESLVRGGLFREDLFYRLNVLRIHVPPLRERRADIVPLAEHFLSLAADPPKTLAASACEALERHDWPGNVRELRNVIERASVLARAALIEATDLDLASAASADARKHATLPSALAALEEAMIRNALAQSGGNRAEAARRLGIRRQLLYAKLRQYGIAS